MRRTPSMRTCNLGHTYRKSSDCPTCPICEKQKPQRVDFLSRLGSPARNTLLHHGVDTLVKLVGHTEKELLKLHGMGKASLPVLREVLEEAGLSFRDPD